MTPQLPPEVIGRIIHYCQPRHSLLSLDHASKRRDIHRRLSRVSKVWKAYATEEASQYLVLQANGDERDSSTSSLCQANWGEWSVFDFNFNFNICHLHFQPRYLSLSSRGFGTEAPSPEPDLWRRSEDRSKDRTIAILEACSSSVLEEAYFQDFISFDALSIISDKFCKSR